MDPRGFLADLERKPQALDELADRLDDQDPWEALPVRLGHAVDRVLLLGMGSSTYAARVAAARMRQGGQWVDAELASSGVLPSPSGRLLVVAVSASGGSAETLAAARGYSGVSPTVGLVNVEGSPLSQVCDASVSLGAGPEVGGVSCRSFQHTLALLLALPSALPGPEHASVASRLAASRAVAASLRRAAQASTDLLERREEWLEPVCERLAGPDGTWVVAPDHRLSSAQQSALMLREGPRRSAVACETGDWSHVDVYLTKTLDYRMLLFTGSPHEAELLRWTRERGSTVVAVGPGPVGPLEGASMQLRHRFDTDDDVRLLTEVLVAELVAQRIWADQG
jgi:glucosamine--fructose-6-phosphate aminotransferase (isomerizing)